MFYLIGDGPSHRLRPKSPGSGSATLSSQLHLSHILLQDNFFHIEFFRVQILRPGPDVQHQLKPSVLPVATATQQPPTTIQSAAQQPFSAQWSNAVQLATQQPLTGQQPNINQTICKSEAK